MHHTKTADISKDTYFHTKTTKISKLQSLQTEFLVLQQASHVEIWKTPLWRK